MVDWDAVRLAYETTDAPLRTIANVHGIKSDNSIRDRAARQKWKRNAGAVSVAQPTRVRPAQVAQPAQVSAQVPAQVDAQVRNDSAPPLDGEIEGPANRDQSGRFLPGVSGNPSGRPASVPEISRLAREKTGDVVKGLYDFATNSQNPGAARVRAYELLAELGWGKSPATLIIADTREGEAVNRASVMEELSAMLDGIADARKHDEARAAAEDAVPA